ncbi:MAG: M48 family metalloprotease [Symploca sp. SIO2G7]|nr:M48 family metalloprotease [Symploca sp. SIO2G7]
MLNPFSSHFRRYRRFLLYPLISVFMAVSLVVTTPQVSQGIPLFELLLRGIQIIQLSSISDNQEVQLGKQINQQLVRQEIRLYRNEQVNRYINQIGQRLAKVSERTDIPYTFQVVDNPSVNAFATMGGFVYMNTGLLKEADNEAEVASVMAHEIAHIVGRHAIKQMKEAAIANGLTAVAGLDRNVAIQLGVELALRRPNSRQHELEADKLGLENLIKAGYAPYGMVSFMEKLLKTGRSVPEFLSTHPATPQRINALEQAIDPNTAFVGDGLDEIAYQNQIRPLLRNKATGNR